MQPNHLMTFRFAFSLPGAIVLGAALNLGPGPAGAWASPEGIAHAVQASVQEQLAAREVRRYLYLRTGDLVSIEAGTPDLKRRGDHILIGRSDQPWLQGRVPELKEALTALGPEEYLLKTLPRGRQTLHVLAGGNDTGTLYAAYRFAEALGVRFYLHGDVIPDQRLGRALPNLDETGRPLFRLRGIQPFHDFPEGPDWWNLDDYKAILSQLPKLRMNFFGLHTYPEGAPNAEPTVWIGTPQDIGSGSQVRFSYPASYQNTMRGNWGYAAKPTGAFGFGASELFERDDFGPEVMEGLGPQPTEPVFCGEVFARTGDLLRDAFSHARRLGIRTCVGTETPLTIPQAVRERLQAQGKDPARQEVLRELYRGIFQRAAQTYPLDYYWFWTPEGWTWSGVKEEQIAATTNDLLTAVAVHAELALPFELATCGWVLGPPQDRALFDKILPRQIALSCINRQVGMEPVEPGFAQVTRPGKWAIPWLEDDPALTSPQLWVGRMRRDAADALAYGCDGLMGIHWRTRVLGPAASALAQAAWDQSAWRPPTAQEPTTAPPRQPGPEGGKHARFPNNPIAGTDQQPVYQSVRYDVTAYHLPAPNGSCAVTLRFCEPHYKEAGKRVFDVSLQGHRILHRLDILERAGPNQALDITADDVIVTNGWLEIGFSPVIEYPSIAGISVQGPDYRTNLNCGGPAWQDFQADGPESASPPRSYPSTADFYSDWAGSLFGPEAGPAVACLFTNLDGRLPRPSDWVDGPGGLRPDARPWTDVSPAYAFVDELAALRSQVRGVGNRARFDWWLQTFQYMRAMGKVNCTWAACTNALGQVKAEPDPETQKRLARELALPRHTQLVDDLREVYRHLLATVSNPGELGTIANWEQHILPGLVENPARELAALLGEDLPAEAQIPTFYEGPARLIVPTVRTSYTPGDPLAVKVLILDAQPPRQASLRWRKLGRGRFAKVPLEFVARGVYQAIFPAEATTGEDLEYYLEARPAQGKHLRFPETAPDLNQTVVAEPVGR